MASRTGLVIRVLAGMALAGGLGFTLLGATASSQVAGRELLPDLEQAVPSQLYVRRVAGPKRPIYQLGFQSAAGNVGEGPLIIQGHRKDLGTPTMKADQLV